MAMGGSNQSLFIITVLFVNCGNGLRVYICALTANIMARDREACYAAGMDHVLAKPLRLDDLVAALGLAALRV